MELMIKREAEKETIEDLKQVFRVFDKVRSIVKDFSKLLSFISRMVTDMFRRQKSNLS